MGGTKNLLWIGRMERTIMALIEQEMRINYAQLYLVTDNIKISELKKINSDRTPLHTH